MKTTRIGNAKAHGFVGISALVIPLSGFELAAYAMTTCLFVTIAGASPD